MEMHMKHFTRRLSALLAVHALVALAAAQEIKPIFPIQNSTTIKPEPTDTTCENRCSVEYPHITAVQWVPESLIVYTTTITVAAVSLIYTTTGNVTLASRTHTVFEWVAPEYGLYSRGTDEQGTAVVTVPIPQSDGFTSWSPITYPTPYLDYSTEYHWSGVMQTYDKASNPACATAPPEAPANVPLPQHPEYPQPTELSLGKNDRLGADHVPLWVPAKDEPNKAFFDAAFPSESAFASCESVFVSPSIPTQYSAGKFVTASTTLWTTPHTEGMVIIQPSATGWDDTGKPTSSSQRPIPPVAHTESSATGFSDAPSRTRRTTRPAFEHIESTADGFGNQPTGQPETIRPGNNNPAGPSPPGNNSPNVPTTSAGAVDNYPDLSPSNELGQHNNIITTEPFPDVSVPTFTFVPTTISGTPTTVPAFLIPPTGFDSGPEIATPGQTVTVNGKVTVLQAPESYLRYIPTTISGTPTSTPVYIISGTSTATIGQTLSLDNQLVTLSVPEISKTTIPVMRDGGVTSSPAWIVSGTHTATVGETVTLKGKTTVLASPTGTENNDEKEEEGAGVIARRIDWRCLFVCGLFGLVIQA